MIIDAKAILALCQVPCEKEKIYYDSEIPGFGLRIRPGGSRRLIFTYKHNGATRRMTLGAAVPEAFPEVRKTAAQLHAKVTLGEDPAGDKAAAAKAVEDRFDKARERFLAFYKQNVRPTSFLETKRYLERADGLQDKLLVDITRRDISGALSVAATNSGSVSANRLKSSLSSMFAWCVSEGLIEENPVIGTTKRKETPRDRSLVDGESGDMSELVRVWKALDDSTAGDIIKLLILTGQRKSEIAGLRWSELDPDMTRILLPGSRTKNGEPHTIPLSEPARVILSQRPRVLGWQCVFGSGANGYVSLGGYKATLDKRLPDMPAWRIHDLRRSGATGMSKRGVKPHVVEAVLNHQSGSKSGVAGVYNRDTYLPEKTAALILWAEHVMAAVTATSAKVVPLRVTSA